MAVNALTVCLFWCSSAVSSADWVLWGAKLMLFLLFAQKPASLVGCTHANADVKCRRELPKWQFLLLELFPRTSWNVWIVCNVKLQRSTCRYYSGSATESFSPAKIHMSAAISFLRLWVSRERQSQRNARRQWHPQLYSMFCFPSEIGEIRGEGGGGKGAVDVDSRFITW